MNELAEDIFETPPKTEDVTTIGGLRKLLETRGELTTRRLALLDVIEAYEDDLAVTTHLGEEVEESQEPADVTVDAPSDETVLVLRRVLKHIGVERLDFTAGVARDLEDDLLKGKKLDPPRATLTSEHEPSLPIRVLLYADGIKIVDPAGDLIKMLFEPTGNTINERLHERARRMFIEFLADNPEERVSIFKLDPRAKNYDITIRKRVASASIEWLLKIGEKLGIDLFQLTDENGQSTDKRGVHTFIGLVPPHRIELDRSKEKTLVDEDKE